VVHLGPRPVPALDVELLVYFDTRWFWVIVFSVRREVTVSGIIGIP